MGLSPTQSLDLINIFLSHLIEDITREKFYIQALLEEKNRAVIASQAKSEFLAAVSHQLRIPLTGIIGMAQLLNLDCLLPGQKEQVEDIIKASEHLLSLVNDLIDLTKLEAGKMELHPAVVDLKLLLEEIINMLLLDAKMKGLEFILNYEQDVPNSVVTDARAIRQIFLNLMSNALKFTEKGYILIQVKCLQEKAGNVFLEFRVQDTGTGISEDKKRIIFDRFSSTDASHTRRYDGMGLGLTLTKHLVELLGGNIWVEGEVDKGSTFVFTIPFSIEDVVTTDSPWEPYKKSVRILIVDDRKGAGLYKHITSSTAEVVSGKEALHSLLTSDRYGEPYDVVIIDQQLTSTDALELGKTINKQLAWHIPMLLLLISPNSNATQEAIEAAGFFACSVQPVQPAKLIIDLTTAWKKWVKNKTTNESHVKQSADSATGRPRVLLVEDDLIVQKVHKKMIENAGCKVDLAKDGSEALTLFKQGYDLILMDVGLPGMSGLEVTKQIRLQEGSQKRIPIVAMTAFVHEEDRKNCLAVGMDDVATKPISSEALKALLKQWIKALN